MIAALEGVDDKQDAHIRVRPKVRRMIRRHPLLALRALGHDVLTVQDTGKAQTAMPDEEVLAFAVEQSKPC